jgi:hypothetical protein
MTSKIKEARERFGSSGPVVSVYKDGFDACYSLMAPEIEKLVEALQTGIQDAELAIAMTGAKPSPGVTLGRKAIDNWREFVGEK